MISDQLDPVGELIDFKFKISNAPGESAGHFLSSLLL